ncbi:Transcriptional regulatory protein ZraR [Fundidesulfovibrio magnetotacticus]|uniref:Transcriptional regulatory protein ZraR n=1 Tax=Fundidesulfovibrio magnetotacticus TaxID=2730080 RepID=A0A6V8LU92_9BACT|nr:PEP-CTERM-box response regulator transcription factor [Fundidesulfovibrio magnetotacticus]GFK93898.1 Transcriptional regulatory protein ZraR [Fundidesulfovibrio magnetotacticus]
MKQKLLIVDDNEDIRQQLKWGLSSEPYELSFAKNAEEALAAFQAHSPQVVTLDLGLPPNTEDSTQGFHCLESMRARNNAARIIVITGFDSRDYARRAVEMGAHDFFLKPINLDELKVMVRRAFQLHELRQDNADQSAQASDAGQEGIIGRSPAIRDLLAQIRRVAQSDVPVLIQGESGTGKELAARALHALSSRARGPMVSINCGALPENLIESEFFGHERGAFTGAVATVQGKVEFAHRGVLFLDEIGELPVNLQVKLLRFLQEQVFQRVGGRKSIQVDVRVLAATNVDIQTAMKSGAFREDLFYRIGVVTLKLPPLRQRGDDVVLLAEHFLAKHSRELAKQLRGFTGEALERLKAHSWPGNVRELENRVRRAMVMAPGAFITAEDLELQSLEAPRTTEPGTPGGTTLKEARSILEKRLVEDALKRSGGNILKASEALGISRPTMYDLLRKHSIET